jgi:glyoxylate utilization-related uncharacterized protein
MKKIFFFLFIINVSSLIAQKNDSLPSNLYYRNNLDPKKEGTCLRRQVPEGKIFALDHFEIYTSTVETDQTSPPVHTGYEGLMIVKDGNVKITMGEKSKIMRTSSIAFAMPYDEQGIENAGTATATYYILKYKGRIPMNLQRAKKDDGSFLLDRNDLTITNTGKGYRSDFFHRATSQLAQFEMHITALNVDSVSHAPHRHIQEEIGLLLTDNMEMQFGDKFY